MDLELKGKTAIVTGGSRGIGKAVARELAREGVGVAIVARTAETLEATAKELSEETDGRVIPIVADTGSDESVRAMVQKAVEAFGHIDILVCGAAQAAGQAPPPQLQQIDDDIFYADMNIKVLGYLRCAREVAPHMERQGWGRIINISGLGARMAGSPMTSMRNVAVVALTKNLADTLGPKGINAVTVHPATTRTEATARVLQARSQSQGISLEDAEKQLTGSSLIGRMVDAREVAYVVTFLASPKAVAINGDVVAAGGGARGSIYY